MPVSHIVEGAAVTSLDQAGLTLGVVEVWDAGGRAGLAAFAGQAPVESAISYCRQAVGRPVTENLPEPPAARWLRVDPAWSAAGAVAAARADLAARGAGVPLWLWLGGKARSGWSRRESGTSGVRTGVAPSELFQSLDRWILERSVDLIRVLPVAAGGPAGVARLDAIARAFQLELELVAETALVISRALTIHLAATTTSATSPPDLAAVDPLAVPWLTAADNFEPGEDRVLPTGVGLGVSLDRDRLAEAGGRRVLVR